MPIQNLENLAYKPRPSTPAQTILIPLFISSSEQASAFAPVGRAPGAILACRPDFDCSNSWGRRERLTNQAIVVKFKVTSNFSQVTCLIFKRHTNLIFVFF